MPESDLRSAYVDILFEQLQSCRYPTPTMMDRFEKAVRDRGRAEEYVQTLLGLMKDERYPSPQLLERVSEALDALERAG